VTRRLVQLGLWSPTPRRAPRGSCARARGGPHRRDRQLPPHRTRAAFERDRVRDAIHAAAGYRTLRFTYRQVTDDPDIVAAALRTALGAVAA
jgi:hypothetical protein